MNSTYQSLSQRIQDLWTQKSKQGQQRIIIAIAGCPGSGKSTIVQHVIQHVAAFPSGPSIVSISADGYHLPLDVLRALPNAKEALARRGAPWTFDGDAVVGLVRQLRYSCEDIIMAPTFDHAIKDPIQNGVAVSPGIQVCLIEGNYLLSNEAPWHVITDLVDDTWLVNISSDLAITRIAKRHLAAGIEESMENALRRAKENDMVNGDYVLMSSKNRYNLLIESIETVSIEEE